MAMNVQQWLPMLGEASANIRRRSAKVLRNFPEHETPSGKHPRRYGDASASSCEPSPRHPRGIGEWLLGGGGGVYGYIYATLGLSIILSLAFEGCTSLCGVQNGLPVSSAIHSSNSYGPLHKTRQNRLEISSVLPSL